MLGLSRPSVEGVAPTHQVGVNKNAKLTFPSLVVSALISYDLGLEDGGSSEQTGEHPIWRLDAGIEALLSAISGVEHRARDWDTSALINLFVNPR